jgi:hypothetical protein
VSAKFIFTVKKGKLQDRVFVYEGDRSLTIGRDETCSIALPDDTVSRYHCRIDIALPEVRARDLGSLNGIYLNGFKVGQRSEFALKPGDTLGFGRSCELGFDIEWAEDGAERFCAICGAPLTREVSGEFCEDCLGDRHKVLEYLIERTYEAEK